MFGKIVAILSLVALPFSATMWYRSHSASAYHRYDLTLYKSVWVYLKDGVCGFEVLSMPTKTASRSEFHTDLGFDPLSRWGSFELQTYAIGPYRTYWIVFPFWLPTGGLVMGCTVPFVQGPGIRWWRKRRGHCEHCGYNLKGNRTGRCSECGKKFQRTSAAK